MPTSLIHQGYEARFDHRLPEARDLFLRALERARHAHSPDHTVQALIALGKTARDLQNLGAAHLHYQEAAEIYRTFDDPLKLAHTLRHLGDILQDQGLFHLAEPHYIESLAIYRAHPEAPPLDLANAIRGYAVLKTETFQPEQALPLWQEARAIYNTLNITAGTEEADERIAHLTQPKPLL